MKSLPPSTIELTVVPLLLEDELINKGGNLHRAEDLNSFVVLIDLIISGQNPANSETAPDNKVISQSKK